MDSYTNRGNTIFSAWTTCLGLFACLNHVTYYSHEPTPTGVITMHDVEDLTVNHQLDADQVNIMMSLDADLTSEFHWNMKLLFAYIVAEYETPKKERNFVTIWDSPVKSVQKAKIAASRILNEYPIRDQYRLLKNRNITLKLRYRTVPITGFLHTKELEPTVFQTPGKYFRKSDEEEKEKKEKEKKEEKASKKKEKIEIKEKPARAAADEEL